MGKKISTYYPDTGKGWAEIHLDSKDESLYIKYFNEVGFVFHRENFPISQCVMLKTPQRIGHLVLRNWRLFNGILFN